MNCSRKNFGSFWSLPSSGAVGWMVNRGALVVLASSPSFRSSRSNECVSLSNVSLSPFSSSSSGAASFRLVSLPTYVKSPRVLIYKHSISPPSYIMDPFLDRQISRLRYARSTQYVILPSTVVLLPLLKEINWQQYDTVSERENALFSLLKLHFSKIENNPKEHSSHPPDRYMNDDPCSFDLALNLSFSEFNLIGTSISSGQITDLEKSSFYVNPITLLSKSLEAERRPLGRNNLFHYLDAFESVGAFEHCLKLINLLRARESQESETLSSNDKFESSMKDNTFAASCYSMAIASGLRHLSMSELVKVVFGSQENDDLSRSSVGSCASNEAESLAQPYLNVLKLCQTVKKNEWALDPYVFELALSRLKVIPKGTKYVVRLLHHMQISVSSKIQPSMLLDIPGLSLMNDIPPLYDSNDERNGPSPYYQLLFPRARVSPNAYCWNILLDRLCTDRSPYFLDVFRMVCKYGCVNSRSHALFIQYLTDVSRLLKSKDLDKSGSSHEEHDMKNAENNLTTTLLEISCVIDSLAKTELLQAQAAIDLIRASSSDDGFTNDSLTERPRSGMPEIIAIPSSLLSFMGTQLNPTASSLHDSADLALSSYLDEYGKARKQMLYFNMIESLILSGKLAMAYSMMTQHMLKDPHCSSFLEQDHAQQQLLFKALLRQYRSCKNIASSVSSKAEVDSYISGKENIKSTDMKKMRRWIEKFIAFFFHQVPCHNDAALDHALRRNVRVPDLFFSSFASSSSVPSSAQSVFQCDLPVSSVIRRRDCQTHRAKYVLMNRKLNNPLDTMLHCAAAVDYDLAWSLVRGLCKRLRDEEIEAVHAQGKITGPSSNNSHVASEFVLPLRRYTWALDLVLSCFFDVFLPFQTKEGILNVLLGLDRYGFHQPLVDASDGYISTAYKGRNKLTSSGTERSPPSIDWSTLRFRPLREKCFVDNYAQSATYLPHDGYTQFGMAAATDHPFSGLFKLDSRLPPLLLRVLKLYIDYDLPISIKTLNGFLRPFMHAYGRNEKLSTLLRPIVEDIYPQIRSLVMLTLDGRICDISPLGELEIRSPSSSSFPVVARFFSFNNFVDYKANSSVPVLFQLDILSLNILFSFARDSFDLPFLLLLFDFMRARRIKPFASHSPYLENETFIRSFAKRYRVLANHIELKDPLVLEAIMFNQKSIDLNSSVPIPMDDSSSTLPFSASHQRHSFSVPNSSITVLKLYEINEWINRISSVTRNGKNIETVGDLRKMKISDWQNLMPFLPDRAVELVRSVLMWPEFSRPASKMTTQ